MKGLLAGVIAIVILAIVIPRPDDADPPQKSAKAARAAAVSTSGSFSNTKSRDGMPTFTASNVGPGTLVEGAVSIANTGRASGYFSLSQKDLSDVPGPNGGALSQKLQLEIRDVSKPSSPVDVYSGPFADMGVRGLGFISPGSDRDYQFTAMIPDTGGPASSISGDNALKGSSASARFVWTVVEGAPPKDERPPRLRVSIPKVQRLLTRPFLETKARCSETCTLAVRGRARAGSSRAFKVRSVPRQVRAGRLTRVRVQLSRPALRSLRRRLLAGRPVAVKLTFTALDGARNRSVVRRIVRLKPRRR